MTPPLSLSALLALIEGATPGPWEVDKDPNDLYVLQQEDGTGIAYDIIYLADADFLAAFDPPTVRVLIEALQEAVEALEVAHEALATAGVVYTGVVTGTISDADGWAGIESALRGPAPEGSIIAYDLADTLSSISAAITLPEQTT